MSPKTRLLRVAKVLLALKRIAAGLDLSELNARRNRVQKAIDEALASGVPPEKMAKAYQMLTQLNMQMGQAVATQSAPPAESAAA